MIFMGAAPLLDAPLEGQKEITKLNNGKRGGSFPLS